MNGQALLTLLRGMGNLLAAGRDSSSEDHRRTATDEAAAVAAVVANPRATEAGNICVVGGNNSTGVR